MDRFISQRLPDFLKLSDMSAVYCKSQGTLFVQLLLQLIILLLAPVNEFGQVERDDACKAWLIRLGHRKVVYKKSSLRDVLYTFLGCRLLLVFVRVVLNRNS